MTGFQPFFPLNPHHPRAMGGEGTSGLKKQFPSKIKALVAFVLLGVTSCLFAGQPRICIVVEAPHTHVGAFAASELSDYLSKLYPSYAFPVVDEPSSEKTIYLKLGSEDPGFPESQEGYLITARADQATISAKTERGMIYGVYGMLEKLGVGFYLSEELLPDPRPVFDFKGWRLRNEPLVEDRYVFNWHNFLSGCTSWDKENWLEWIDHSQKMGYNAIMVHAYFNNPMHSYSYKGLQKKSGFYTTSAIGREWGNIPLNDIRRLPGGEIFDSAVFGSSAAMVPEDQYVESIQSMMKDVFNYARTRDMGVCFAMDSDKAIEFMQDTLVVAVPADAKFVCGKGKKKFPNPDSAEGQAFYTAQIKGLLESYPMLTEIACWRRGRSFFGSIKAEELPVQWQVEFEEFTKHEAVRGIRGSVVMSCFITFKLVKAYEQALEELGRSDIKITTGTWNNLWVVPTAVLLPDTKLMPIDYGVKRNESLMQDEEILNRFKQYADGRVIPFLWTHHDDGQYIGRCYKPVDKMYSKLAQAGAAGFGSFHWLTRPQDLFFKNAQRQVWAQTVDEPCRDTATQMAKDYWGDAELGDYLMNWITDAPIFGRATLPNMHRRSDKECLFTDETRALVSDRLVVLNSIDTKGMSREQADRLQYFKTLEQFISEFIDTQRHLDQAEKFLKENQLIEAQAELRKGHPEQAVETFARLSCTAQENRGEMAYVVSLATKWIGDYDSFRQRARMLPIKIKLGETVPEAIAQSSANLWYYIDQNGAFWEKLGYDELKAQATVDDPAAAVVKRESTGNESPIEEIFLEGIQFSKASLPIQPIKRSEGVPNNTHVTQGGYRLHIFASSKAGGSISVEINGITTTFSVKGDEELTLFVDVKKTAPLSLGYEVKSGEVVLCGLSLDPVER